MFYFQNDSNGNLTAKTYDELDHDVRYLSRHDFETLADAQAVADELNGFPELNIAPFSDKYIATDAGTRCSPQFDVIERPQIGDKVSYGFNGDSYPCGVIIKISPTLKKITTTAGKVFYRRHRTGCWKMGGTWSMISGHHDKRNPSF